jgi:hypothetical protein
MDKSVSRAGRSGGLKTGASVEFTAVQDATSRVNEGALLLATRGQLDAADAAYGAGLLVLYTMLGGDQDALFGWQRVASLLSDTRTRLILDALAAPRISRWQIRAAALLDLPDLTSVASMADIHAVITAAINGGAPRYNAGDIRGCCTKYWATVQSLLAAPAVRGFPGHAKAMAQLRPITELEVPPGEFDAAGIDNLAWTLRYTLDATLRITG